MHTNRQHNILSPSSTTLHLFQQLFCSFHNYYHVKLLSFVLLSITSSPSLPFSLPIPDPLKEQRDQVQFLTFQ